VDFNCFVKRPVEGVDPAFHEIVRLWVNRELEISVEKSFLNSLCNERDEISHFDEFHNSLEDFYWRQAHFHCANNTEQAIAAYDQSKQFSVLCAVASLEIAIGIDERE